MYIISFVLYVLFIIIDPVTPLKCISPHSVATRVSQCLDSVSPISASNSSADCVMIPAAYKSWKLHTAREQTVAYRLLTNGLPDHCPPVYITHIVSFTDRWQLWVHGKLLALTPTLSHSSLSQLLEHIEACHLCEGVTDPSLLDVLSIKSHNAIMDEVPTVSRDGTVRIQTYREVNCELLITSSLIRCQHCTKLREKLRHKAERIAKKSTTCKFTPNVHLSTTLKLSKLSELANEKEASKRKIAALTARVQSLYTNCSFPVDESFDANLTSIMTKESDALQKTLLNDGFKKIFWEQQLKSLSCKDPRQRR